MVSPQRWVIGIQDSPDGSGDGILQFPDELWDELVAQGWEVGDVLEIDVGHEPGSAVIRNRYAECRS
ncbi:hypothetical protein BM43_7638 (plasmid) [Burkholderia gladioli]|nr:hypothetical protein BM43_7638 [Burkholderia gladioli]